METSRLTLVPPVATRSIVVGTTGSGKTVLMQKLALECHERQPVLVLDPKGRWELPDFAEVWAGPDESPPDGSYVVYRPRFGANIPGDADKIGKMVFEMGDTCVVIDEVFPLLGADTVQGPPGLKWLYTMGRGKNITMIAGVQRPASIPVYFVSECEQAYVFNLRNPDDRKRLAGYFGEEHRGETLSPQHRELIAAEMGPEPENLKYWFRYSTDAEGCYPHPQRLKL